MIFRWIVCSFSGASIPADAQGQAPAPQAQPLGGPAGARREVTVTAIPGVVAAGAQWTLAWQGTDNADGIVGTEDGGLLFAQEQPNRVSKLDPNDKVSVFVQNTRGAGSVTSTPAAASSRRSGPARTRASRTLRGTAGNRRDLSGE